MLGHPEVASGLEGLLRESFGECGNELSGGLVAFAGIFFGGTAQDRVDFLGEIGVELADLGQGAFQVLFAHLELRISLEGGLS